MDVFHFGYSNILFTKFQEVLQRGKKASTNYKSLPPPLCVTPLSLKCPLEAKTCEYHAQCLRLYIYVHLELYLVSGSYFSFNYN